MILLKIYLWVSESGSYGMGGSRGGGGGGPRVRTPPENSQKFRVSKQYWSESPKKSQSYQASIQCWAIIGPPAKRHLKSGIVVFRYFLPSSTTWKKNKNVIIGPPLTKFLDLHMYGFQKNILISKYFIKQTSALIVLVGCGKMEAQINHRIK